MKDKFNLTSLLTERTKEALIDITEMSLDESLSFLSKDNPLLNEMPIIKWVVASRELKSSISNMLFIKNTQHL